MAIYAIPQALEERLAHPASEALAELLQRVHEEDKKDVISRIDEKVNARYDQIHRRIHEDVAGLEIRLTRQMSDLKTELRTEMAMLELRMTNAIAEVKVSTIRWIVSSL